MSHCAAYPSSLRLLTIVSAAAAAMALFGLSQTCQAQSAAPSTSKSFSKAIRPHIDEATQAYGAGRYEAALVALRKAEAIAEEAEQLEALATVRYNIARCLEKLGRKREALEAYEVYDRLPDLPHRKQKAFTARERLRGSLLGVLAVTCQQDGATVTVPQISDAAAGCPFRSKALEPGRYEVEVNAPGFKRATRSVQVRAGATAAIDIELSPLPPPPPSVPRDLGIGVSASEPESVGGAWPWITIGGGVALIAIGGTFHAAAVSDGDDAVVEPPTPRREQLVSDFETNRDLAYVFYGVGGAVTLAGIVWKILQETSGGDEELAGFEPTADGIRVRF